MQSQSTSYPASELARLLERGPSDGEDFFRVKATGHGETHWFNVSAGELQAFADILAARAS